MRSKPFLLTLSVVLVATSLLASTRAEGRGGKIENIVYGRAGDHDLKLDLYLPAEPAVGGGKSVPVVIYFHGGGWRIGGKGEGKRFARMFNGNGIAFATAEYRLSGEARWPAPILDGKTAVRWLRANSRRYGLDPERIGAFGASAGGHIAALLGTTPGIKDLEDRSLGSARESSRVQAVCDVSGPVDLSIPTDRLIGKLSVLGELGGSAQEKPELVRQADPSRYVKGGEPPFLIIQGARDDLVVSKHAYKLQAALTAHGGDVTLDVVPDGGHVPLKGEKQQNEILAFFKKYLGRKR